MPSDGRIGGYRWRERRSTSSASLSLSMDPDALSLLSATSGALRSLSKDMEKEFRRSVVKAQFLDPLAAAMRSDAMAAGRQGPATATTIKSGGGVAPYLSVGAERRPQWAGMVFGGQRGTMSADRKDRQTMTWRRADGGRTRRLIMRRQTMQFLPHAGTRAYLIFPTWRRIDAALTRRLVSALDRFVEEKV